eukprot:911163-Pyramimonas_sp.AAC.1
MIRMMRGVQKGMKDVAEEVREAKVLAQQAKTSAGSAMKSVEETNEELATVRVTVVTKDCLSKL